MLAGSCGWQLWGFWKAGQTLRSADSPERSLLPHRWHPASVPGHCGTIQTASFPLNPQWGLSEIPHLYLLSCTLERKTPAPCQGREGLRLFLTWTSGRTQVSVSSPSLPTARSAAPRSWGHHGLLPSFPTAGHCISVFSTHPPIS